MRHCAVPGCRPFSPLRGTCMLHRARRGRGKFPSSSITTVSRTCRCTKCNHDPPGSSSESESASISVSIAATTAFSHSPFKSIPVYSHHRRDTRAPGRRVAFSHRSRIGRVAMNCTTVFCIRRIDVLIPTIPVSFIIPANYRYIQRPSFLCRGCLPVIFLATLDWKLSRAFSICAVNTHVSDPNSKTAWVTSI